MTDTNNLRLWADHFEQHGELGVAKVLREAADEIEALRAAAGSLTQETPEDETSQKMSAQRIAKITSTSLGYEDHGILSAQVFVDYGGSGQGIGGYCFDEPLRDEEGKFLGRRGTAYGMEWIARFLRACGVDSWEKLVGRTIYVLTEDDSWNARVIGVAPLPTERGEAFIYDDLKAVLAAGETPEP